MQTERFVSEASAVLSPLWAKWTHRQSCRNTSCKSRFSTATLPNSGCGRLLMASAAACCMNCWPSVGLMRRANAPANCISRARTYSCTSRTGLQLSDWELNKTFFAVNQHQLRSIPPRHDLTHAEALGAGARHGAPRASPAQLAGCKHLDYFRVISSLTSYRPLGHSQKEALLQRLLEASTRPMIASSCNTGWRVQAEYGLARHPDRARTGPAGDLGYGAARRALVYRVRRRLSI